MRRTTWREGIEEDVETLQFKDDVENKVLLVMLKEGSNLGLTV